MLFDDVVQPKDLLQSGAKGVKLSKHGMLTAGERVRLLLILIIGRLLVLVLLLDAFLVGFQILFHVDVGVPIQSQN